MNNNNYSIKSLEKIGWGLGKGRKTSSEVFLPFPKKTSLSPVLPRHSPFTPVRAAPITGPNWAFSGMMKFTLNISLRFVKIERH